jgi:hypothetical protein
MYRDTANVEHEMYDHTSTNGATRIVTKRLKKNLEDIPGKHSTHSLKKIAVSGTPHKIWKVQQSGT